MASFLELAIRWGACATVVAGLSSVAVSAHAQVPPPADTALVLWEVDETPPELIGGLDSLQARLRYPEDARAAGVEGRVFVQLVVRPDGCPSDLRIARSPDSRLDAEALRLVAGARFLPGAQQGKPVAMRYALPVTFRLSE